MDRTLPPADIAHYDPSLAELSMVPASHGAAAVHASGPVSNKGQRLARLPNARPQDTPSRHRRAALAGSAEQRRLEAMLRP
jgi:hypothetical protein